MVTYGVLCLPNRIDRKRRLIKGKVRIIDGTDNRLYSICRTDIS